MLWDDDMFDSRQVIERLVELEDATEPEDIEERAILAAFAGDAERYCPDWQYGETFISARYFVEYAQELAEDIGAISSDQTWPACYIDWDAAADALRQDYTSYTIEGQEYLAR